MTTNPSTKPNSEKKASPSTATTDPEPEIITLDKLASDVGMSARDARLVLRLAAKQKSKFPNLGKEHTPRQPWQWTPGSKALEEARTALTTNA